MSNSILVCSLCRNEADVLPYYLRHYGAFADMIVVFDDDSDDGSRDILNAHPKVQMTDWPEAGGIDEDAFLRHAHKQIELVSEWTDFDWIIWPDIDELVYHPDWQKVLDEDGKGVDVFRTEGFNMTGDGLPAKDDGRQLWEQMPMGVRAPVYSKPIVFRPGADIKWVRGKHALEGGKVVLSPIAPFRLLHYRYLGYAYTAAKNKKNLERVGLATGDKGAAWSCQPSWKGEHSPEWAEEAKKVAFNVMTTPLANAGKWS